MDLGNKGKRAFGCARSRVLAWAVQRRWPKTGVNLVMNARGALILKQR